MAKRNLIIGGFTNYGIEQLKPWVLSAKEVSDENTDVVLVYGNTTQETLNWLEEQKVLLWKMEPINGIPVHVLRFNSIYEFLRLKWEEYEYVVTTDVKDVYFQSNPFMKLKGHKLVVASEGLKYKDEPWGNENLFQTYGPYVYELNKHNEIFNVGTFGGTSEFVKDMVFNIFTNAINRPVAICDQAVFNVLIQTQPFKDVIKQTYDWACEAGTVVDPNKIHMFRPNLMCDEPTFEHGLVKYKENIFPIVHQYDRVPEWKEFVRKKYGQADESQLFVYRT